MHYSPFSLSLSPPSVPQQMDPTKDVLLVVQPPVATITFNRPQGGNSLNVGMMKRLAAIFTDLRGNDSVRVIVLTGNGKYFCTGMDLSGSSPADFNTVKPQEVFELIWQCPKPIVCAANGPALGGGAGLFFTTDIRIVHEGFYIAFPEVQRGIFPALISAYITPQLGPYLTQALMLTAERFDASRMAQSGVVSAVVEDVAALGPKVDQVVRQLLQSPTCSHSGVKRSIRLVGYGGDFHRECMSTLGEEFRAMRCQPEAAFALRAFASKGQQSKIADWGEFYRLQSAERKKNAKQRSNL